MNFSESIFKSKNKAKTVLSCFKKRTRPKCKIHCENGGVIVVSAKQPVRKETRRHLDRIFSARAKSIQGILLLAGSGRYFCEFLDDRSGSGLRCRLKIEFKHVLYEGEGRGFSLIDSAANALELLSRARAKQEHLRSMELADSLAS